MKQFFALLLLPVFSFAQAPAKDFQLNGQLALARPADWVYLRYINGDQAVYDSAGVTKGSFRFNGKIAEPTTATLVLKYVAQPGEEKLQKEVIPLFLEPGAMEFTAKDSLKNFSVKGSSANADFAVLMKQREAYESRLVPLYEQYDSLQKVGDKAGMKKVEQSMNEVGEEMKNAVYASFLKAHPNSPVALYALKQYAGWDIDPAQVEPLFNLLPETVQSWPSAVAFRERIDIAKKTAVGSYAMDFTQNDTLGRPVSLSSFKGKYVLVDFWASWCGPCRRENPNVVKVFNEFRDKNFTILSVSLDRPNDKDKWLAAIHKDGLTWTHVSDLKFWDNDVARQYGIRAIPQNLLIDPGGKIVAKNLTGDDLGEKLGELLGK